jgi:hypothetical protein
MVDGWALFFAWSELAVLVLALAYFVLWRRPR